MDSQSLQVVHFEQAFDQFFAFLGDVVVDVLKVASLDLLEEICLALGAEGVVALQHHVEEDSQRPHVGVNWAMIHLRYDFGGHVGGSAAESVDSGVAFAAETETEVNQLQLSVSVYQDVLSLYVAVDDLKIVQVLQRLCNYEEKLLCLCFGQSVLRLGEEVVVERISAAILKDEVQLCLRFNDIYQFGNGGV